MSGKTLADYKAPYPKPTAEQKRVVIYLDTKADEDQYKIQLIPGRMEMTDGCNNYFMGGTIEEKTIQGWGYSYWVVNLGLTACTLMMAIGDAAQGRRRFVSMNNDELIRYNSKLPIVVFVPKDAELHYKIWSVSGVEIPAKQE